MRTTSAHPKEKSPEKVVAKSIRKTKPDRKAGQIPADRGDREIHSKSEGSE